MLSKSLFPTNYQESGNSLNLRIVSLSIVLKKIYDTYVLYGWDDKNLREPIQERMIIQRP